MTADKNIEANGILIIYGHRYCSQANLLRDSLDQKQISYEWRDIREGDPDFQEELQRAGKWQSFRAHYRSPKRHGYD